MGVDVDIDVASEVAAEPEVTPLLGNPSVVGLPTVIAGAVGLGMVNAGFFTEGALGATVAILMGATAIGLLIATLWAAALGQNAGASMFGVFFGFYASYVALVFGLTHGWYGPVEGGGSEMVQAWLVCWLVAIGVLTVVTLRLPAAFTLLLVIVDVALALLLVGSLQESTTFTRIGSAAVFAFAAVATYLYADSMSRETGGDGLPLGGSLRH